MQISNNSIIRDDNPLIREKSVDVKFPLSKEDEELLLNMYKAVDQSTEENAPADSIRPAVGISAIQLGIPKKMTAVTLKDENGDKRMSYALVNPKIISNSVEKAYLSSGEGCLSVDKDHKGYIYRSARIKVRGYDILQKKYVEIKAAGYPAIVLQHELDHFKGILYYDHIDKKDPFHVDPDAICL